VQNLTRLGRILGLAPDVGAGDAHRSKAHAIHYQVAADGERAGGRRYAARGARGRCSTRARGSARGSAGCVRRRSCNARYSEDTTHEYLPASEVRCAHERGSYNRACAHTIRFEKRK
jgi:hypothetical protein